MTKFSWTRRGALAGVGGLAACSVRLETPAYDGQARFEHGVASGDPTPTGVVIWTRVTVDRAGPAPVRWIVARDRALADVVASGVLNADERRDYTVKADVTGLRPGAAYFYGFRAGDAQSPIGKTRTLPRGRVRQAKLAALSCASYAHGYFNVYEALAKRRDIDLVIHLGDYIYEYGVSGYGAEAALALGRIPSPEVELRTLADYRQRHAQYKREPELQAAHAMAAWVVVWDDHEIANDCWTGGAENHQPDEGDWAARKRAALQAYYEWMPIREPAPGQAFEAINRAFEYGDLFTLAMLETRLLARTQQLDYARDLPLALQRWDFSNPRAPVALRPNEADRPGQRLLPAIFETVSGETRPVLDWRRAGTLTADVGALPPGFFLAPDVEALNAKLAAPERALLGPRQETWLAETLTQSKARGAAWRILGNQVLMAKLDAPDLSATPPALAQALDRASPGVARLLPLTRTPFPLSTDAWDGYPAQRARVYAMLRESGGAIVLSGDSHAAWVNDLADGGGRAGVELGVPSVTSPSDAEYFTSAGIDFAAGVRARNANVRWTDPLRRGFLVLSLTRTQAEAEFVAVSTVSSKQYDVISDGAFRIAPGGAQVEASGGG